MSARGGGQRIAPSYVAVATLSESRWVILTNGKVWRLYTNRISASTTNYFEITLDRENEIITKYLIAIFGAAAYDSTSGVADIDKYFDEGKRLAKELETDLADTIMYKDVIFIDIVKGVLNHDLKTTYTPSELESAKNTALKIMYRVWFVLYAESRRLLPVQDRRYMQISLRTMRDRLSEYEEEPNGTSCWEKLLELFEGIRDGSVKYNLPQYNGELFRNIMEIDGGTVQNKFIAKALRGLLEKDGESVDYANLGVRHLGSIYESLLEFSVNQAQDNIMLIEKGGKMIEVKSGEKCTYSYKKNDLYLGVKGRIAHRKSSGSYYTPDKIVEYLVESGLEPILREREKFIKTDIARYKKTQTVEDLNVCIDRLLDIQVLDPSMGSGHFLVEALNQLTVWVTDMLQTYREHPLVKEIETDRQTVIQEQKKKGITIDENLLEDSVLLKRKIMKRCIFGVDLNPMAVDLAKLSLWLDSFAIGVPLTYMDHHIKIGDSAIGSGINELNNPENSTMDEWIESPEEKAGLIEKVGHITDVTIEQAKKSRWQYEEYKNQVRPQKVALDALTASKIDKKIIPKQPHKKTAFLKRLTDAVSGNIKIDKDLDHTITYVRSKAEDYKFFHWELEMIDAFTDKRSGFDLITGNPPWDKIRPNEVEFFTNINPGYKQMSSSEKLQIKNKYKKEHEAYKNRLVEKRAFYKDDKKVGKNTDYEMYRIIISKMLPMLARGGMLSMIMPTAILNSRGATALRKFILDKNIISLYVFENKKKIFPIHLSYRFALLTFQNVEGSDQFRAGFYLHSLETLDKLKHAPPWMSKTKIKELSTKMHLIYEVKNMKEWQIIQEAHKKHPRLEDTKIFSVELGRELNMMGGDNKFIVKNDGWPVLKSENFHQHIHNYSEVKDHVDIRRTLKRVKTIKKFHEQSELIHDNPRLVYRTVSTPTATRSMVTCIAPQRIFTTIPTYMALPRIGMFQITPEYYKITAYLCGIFNSTTYDYLIRAKIDKNIHTYHVEDTPIPELFTSNKGKRISKLSAFLFLAETWHDDMANVHAITKQEVKRVRLKDRIAVVAEIDALSALQYELSKNEYEHVLKTFRTNAERFSDDELKQETNYKQMTFGERSMHMRTFYNEVYELTQEYYDKASKIKDYSEAQ